MEERFVNRIPVVILGLVIISSSRFADAACQRGWINHGNSCYFIGKTELSFADALVVCHNLGSDLAEIESSNENTFIVNSLKNTTTPGNPHGFWIGLTDIEVKNDWKWLSSGSSVTYSNWHPGQPELRLSEDCGILWSSTGYTWHDDFCSDIKAFFVCESVKGTKVSPL